MNKRTDFVIPECYVDTNLVETLVCYGGCNHQKGCNQVSKVMQENFSDRFAIGIIDADKRRPSYLNEFLEIASSTHLKVLHHPVRPHYIILVAPAIDGFILSCVQDSRINIEDFELSPVLKKFTEQSKNVTSNKDPRFKRLFKAIKDIGEMKLLCSILTYLTTTKFDADDDVLVSLFNDD